MYVAQKRSYTTQHGIILLGQMFVHVLFFHWSFHRYSTGIAMIYIVQVSYYITIGTTRLEKESHNDFNPKHLGIQIRLLLFS